MNEDLELAKRVFSDIVPFDDPEYEKKVEAYAKALLELDINELPLGKPGDENIIDDLPW